MFDESDLIRYEETVDYPSDNDENPIRVFRMRVPAGLIHQISRALKTGLVNPDVELELKYTTKGGNVVYARLKDEISTITVDVFHEEIE